LSLDIAQPDDTVPESGSDLLPPTSNPSSPQHFNTSLQSASLGNNSADNTQHYLSLWERDFGYIISS
jgi:hypothetical protein